LKPNPQCKYTDCGSRGGVPWRNTEPLPRHAEAELGKPKLELDLVRDVKDTFCILMWKEG